MLCRTIRNKIRSVLNRALDPYFVTQNARLDQLVLELQRDGSRAGNAREADATPNAADPALPLALTDFNHLLHELRTVEVNRMPQPSSVLLSVGCSDRSYFDWLNRAMGPIKEHWGIEFYRPEPDQLPEGVRWIVASASSMPQVPDRAVDVVFSGQNIEHLPQNALLGFLTESHRVLEPGGYLVVDSPNRLITEALGWRHPEHVVELSPTEAVQLITLAGFEVESCRGIWSCQELDGTILPLMPEPGDVGEILRRSVQATSSPDRAFCWWIEARALDKVVDDEALARAIGGLFEAQWLPRVNRWAWSPGTRSGSAWEIAEETTGVIYRAGPIPLFAGTARFDVNSEGGIGLTVRVVDSADVCLAEGTAPLELTVEETIFGTWIEVLRSEPSDAVLRMSSVTVALD